MQICTLYIHLLYTYSRSCRFSTRHFPSYEKVRFFTVMLIFIWLIYVIFVYNASVFSTKPKLNQLSMYKFKTFNNISEQALSLLTKAKFEYDDIEPDAILIRSHTLINYDFNICSILMLMLQQHAATNKQWIKCILFRIIIENIFLIINSSFIEIF